MAIEDILMNKKQLAYQYGRLVNNESDYLTLGLMGLGAGAGALGIIALLRNRSFAAGASGAYLLSQMKKFYKDFKKQREARKKLEAKLVFIQGAQKIFQVQNADEVILDDRKGVTRLLERTSRAEDMEWGTSLRIRYDKGRAIVESVILPEYAEMKGIVTEKTENHVTFNRTLMEKLGHNGKQHYHPGEDLPKFMGNKHYAINNADRAVCSTKGVDLLTFNTEEGPQIIAYNSHKVYLPTDNPKRLVEAKPDDVLAYLSK